MEWLKIILVFYTAVICNSQTSAVQHLGVKVDRLNRHMNMLHQDIEDIWKALSDAGLNSLKENNDKTKLDDISTSEMIQQFNASIADMHNLKLEVEQLVRYARKGFGNEKSLNRDAISKLTSFQNELQSRTTKDITEITLLLQSFQDKQQQVIDELTAKFQNTIHNLTQDYTAKFDENKAFRAKFQNTIHNLTQDYTAKFDENKAETKTCFNKLTSVEQDLAGVTQDLEGVTQDLEGVTQDLEVVTRELKDVEKEAEGNKNMISSVNYIINKVFVCDDHWDRFLDHCYKIIYERKTWDEANENCQNIDSSLLEIDSNEEFQFILDTYTGEYYIWVGAHDREQEGQFIWQHSKQPVQKDLWALYQPNNYHGNEHCALLSRYPAGKLHDETCSRRIYFVCEKNIKIF